MANAIEDYLFQLESVSVTFLVIITVAISMRLYTRIMLLKSVAWDDYAMICAYLCSAAGACVILVMVEDSFSLIRGHFRDIDALVVLLKAATALYVWAMMFIKLSLGIFFLRMFSVHLPQQIILYAALIISLLSTAVCLWAALGTCALRGIALADQCSFKGTFMTIIEVWAWINTIVDMVFSAVAIYALCKATMHPTARIGAILAILCGTAGGFFSLARIIWLMRYETAALRHILIWSGVEQGMCITAACMAFTRPLLQTVWTKMCALVGRKSGSHGPILGGDLGIVPRVMGLDQDIENGVVGVSSPVEKKNGVLVETQILVP